MRLGIDIGRVIIGPRVDGVEDTRFIGRTLDEAIHTPPAEGAFESIQELVETFRGQVWLVSKAGPSVQRKTRHWLEHHHFYEATGLRREHLVFCLKRHEKVGICRKLRIDHFIDDRADVLEPMEKTVRHRLLFGEQKGRPSRGLVPVADWDTVMDWFDSRSVPGKPV